VIGRKSTIQEGDLRLAKNVFRGGVFRFLIRRTLRKGGGSSGEEGKTRRRFNSIDHRRNMLSRKDREGVGQASTSKKGKTTTFNEEKKREMFYEKEQLHLILKESAAAQIPP